LCKLNRKKVLLASFFLVSLLIGCIPASFAKTPPTILLETKDDATLNENPVTKDWTFIMYHDADNDLGRYAIADLQEMVQGRAAMPSGVSVNIVVLYDTYGAYPQSYYIDKDGAYLIHDYANDNPPNELDMGNPKTLDNFLNDWVFKYYPATHYVLNMWDHGDDFLGSCKDYHGDTVPVDGHSFLLHKDLVQVIHDNFPGKLDVLSFDACIESMMEVAYYYKDVAKYLVVAEDYVTYWGFPYDAILSDFGKASTKDAPTISHIFVDDFMAAYLKPNGNGGGGYVMAFPTFSAIDLSQTDSIITDLNTIASELSGNVAAYKGAISSARAKAILNMPITGWDADIDFYTFIDKVATTTHNQNINAAVNSIKLNWGNFIYTKCSDQYATKSAYGLGIYFPPSRGFLIHNTMTDAAYYFGTDKTGVFNVPLVNTQWGHFLRSFFDYWDSPVTPCYAD
jgi:hypothetical protein